MKYSIEQLELNIYLKDLVIDTKMTRQDDIINEVTKAIENAVSKYTSKGIEADVEYVDGLAFDKSEEDKKVLVYNIEYDLYDDEIEERNLPSEVELTLGEVNKSSFLEVGVDWRDAISIAINDYMYDNDYAKLHEQIVYDFDYELIK